MIELSYYPLFNVSNLAYWLALSKNSCTLFYSKLLKADVVTILLLKRHPGQPAMEPHAAEITQGQAVTEGEMVTGNDRIYLGNTEFLLLC